MAAVTYSDWRHLPFREIWCVDFEYYPGAGLANGGREGDQISPLCLVAFEMRSGRYVELWQDGFGPFPPYSLGGDALLVGYMLTAEFGAHLALGWGQPARAADPYVEFRHLTNDARVKSGEREKGFYSLPGALRYFGDNGVDLAHKRDMRERIVQGPPFSRQERRDILAYCRDDVDALARLFPSIVPTVRSWPHAHMRAQFMWAAACQERRGVPLDLPLFNRIRYRWRDIEADIVGDIGAPFGAEIEEGGVRRFEPIYAVGKDGRPHWRSRIFEAYVRRRGIAWPTRADGKLDECAETFEDMCQPYPELNPLRELRASLAKLRLNTLPVGSDGRNRTLLGPYGSKTGRNQPSNSKYIFGPAKWTRSLISPPSGRALTHRDYCQQEVRIAAVLAGDGELLAACETGDVYLGIAKQLGLAPGDATGDSHPDVRDLFKTVVLGISYGLGARSLALRTGVSLFEAAEILARLRTRFHRFEDFMAGVADRAGLDLELSTPFDWRLRCPPGTNPRTVRNFPMQSTGAEILHVASILAERRGVSVVAPVHDALMAEAPAGEIEQASTELDRLMRDAAAVVLRGYELPTDKQIVRPGEHFRDKRGSAMWTTVRRRLAKLEAQAA
ncbi:DNA polymerase [Methylocystis suflitae]|uniref:DNA polymerase n=1 Tax=Methylocystis suflitae TaxID=2951405 RepID=UPI00210E1E7B|nr:DNA polymerase [Methylocystis suflitae]MCQ4188855.1 DNA polymerase [Methylocystis suflitae]